MNETDKGPDVCQNQDEGLNETQGVPDGSRELSDSSHELPDGMEIDMSHYKEGSAAAKCVLGVILLLCFIFMSRSCNYRHSTLTFYMGPEPEVNLGSQYYEEGRYQEAADYYQEKVDEVFSNGKRYEPANGPLYFNLGMAYYKLENYDQALLYLKECADVDKRTSNTEELAWDYNTMADVCKDAGHMDEALNYYEKGLKAIKKACGKDSEYTAIFLSDLGDAYKKTEDYEKALENYQQALEIQESNGSDQTWSYIRIARIYNALKDYDAAKHFYGKASGSETADSYTKGVRCTMSAGSILLPCPPLTRRWSLLTRMATMPMLNPMSRIPWLPYTLNQRTVWTRLSCILSRHAVCWKHPDSPRTTAARTWNNSKNS